MSPSTEDLSRKSREIRRLVVDMIGRLGVGHIGGSLSIVEAMVVVYYKYMRIDPAHPEKPDRDRFVLSKGHAGPTLYAVLADMGFFPKELLHTLNRNGTTLPSHPDIKRTPGVDMTTGSLGQGLSAAVGMALASRYRKDGVRVYAVIGDGESHEGQIWEAAMYAAHMKLDNLIAFTDFNNLVIDGTVDEMNGLEPLDEKWRAFGWSVATVDGHDIAAIDAAVENARAVRGRPSMIILKTTKGKGVSFVEAALTANHNMTLSPEQHAQALAEIAAEGN